MKNSLIALVMMAIAPMASVYAKPEPLSFVLIPKKAKKGTPPTSPHLLSDYQIYWHAQNVFESKKLNTIAVIEGAEKGLLTAKLNSPSRSLEKESEELFWALEFKRGEAAVAAKNYELAITAFQRGLQGLTTLKWPYYWRESTSAALAKLCTRNKKVKDEVCLQTAKRVAEVFPKTAKETKLLRDLPDASTATTNAEVGGDRLSANYPADKTDKDEKDFELVLAAYQSESKSDLSKNIESFLKDYPRSILRFRAQFLMAELLTKKGLEKDAAPIYQSIIDQSPLGFYALVSAERLKQSHKDKIKKQPLQVDVEQFNFNAQERLALARAIELAKQKKWSEVGNELDVFTRSRAYNMDTLLYLMGLANRYQQNLNAFKFVSELIQRQSPEIMSSEIMEIVFPFLYEKEISDAAKTYKLDPLWIFALTKQESGFRSLAISTSGALGLMQLMPFTAVEVQPDVPLYTLKNAAPNIMVGTKYLASLVEKYEGNVPFALAAYNAGPNRVAKWKKDLKPGATMIDFIESIPFKETREYVMSIVRNRYWYQVRKGQNTTSLFETWNFKTP